MNRRRIHSSRSFLIMVGLTLALAVAAAVSRPAQAERSRPGLAVARQQAPVASLDPVEGLVQYQPQERDPTDLGQWDNATDLVLVGEGDRVRTDASGFAYLTFFEGLETDVGPDTMVVVSTLDIPQAGEENPFDVTLDVLVGNTLSNVDTLLDAEDSFEIHTPGATALVRGTKWYTLVQPNGDTIFSALEGTVYILPKAMAQPGAPPPQLSELIPLMPGFSLFVSQAGVAGEPYEGMEAQFDGPQSGALAQDTTSANPAILVCVESAGCTYSATSGELTTDQLTSLVGENQTAGTTIVCTTTGACQWSASSAKDLDVQFGGDGSIEAPTADLVPVAGAWVGHNLAGSMECSGLMAMAMPATPPEGIQMIVEEGGARFTLESSSPDIGTVPMERVQPGVYHGVFEMTVEGEVLSMDFDEVFVTPTLATGMIHGQVTSQGITCTITRPFYATAAAE